MRIIKAVQSFTLIIDGKNFSTHRMRVDDVFEHVIDGSLRCIAFPVIPPSTSGSGRRQGRPIRQPAAERFAAIGVRAFLIIRVVVRVRNVENFEGRAALLRHDRRFRGRLRHGREGDFPVVLRVVRVVASVADDEAANLRGSHGDLLQDVDDLALLVQIRGVG